MNKKIIMSVTLGIILILLASTFYIMNSEKLNGQINISNSGNINESDTGEINENEEMSIIGKKGKLGDLRKKLALKGLIINGDINLENGDYNNALLKYLQINKEIPNDKSIIKKIGDVYYKLKKFDKAYLYYSKIKNYDKIDKNQVAITLISSMMLTDKNIVYINNELSTLGLNQEELYYYKTSLECKINFSECRKEFTDYFNNRKKQVNTTGTGTISGDIKFQGLIKIQKALENYENFQLDDLDYKGALVVGAFFENGLYPIAIETAKTVLKTKKDYKPLMKIIAKSYFELGNYIQAKLYLIEYSNLVKDNSEISYFLGVVYEKLNEYMLSTIHLNKAIELGYKDTLEIYKRVLFNYHELGEIEKMLETFKLMVNAHKDKLSIDDYNMAIYYNIVNDKIKDAKEYTNYALSKYPESEIFNGYMGWILMDEVNKKYKFNINPGTANIKDNEKGGTGSIDYIERKKQIAKLYEESEKYINKGLELNSKSAMLNLVKGKIEMYKGDYKKSVIYFDKTISIDPIGEFGEMAKLELKNIKVENK